MFTNWLSNNLHQKIIEKPNNLKVSGARTPQGPKQNTQYRIRSHMHKGGEWYLVNWLILSHLEQAWSIVCTYTGCLVAVHLKNGSSVIRMILSLLATFSKVFWNVFNDYIPFFLKLMVWFGFMVFSTTFNNISVKIAVSY